MWVSQPAALCSVSACPKPDELPFSTVVPLKQSHEPGEQIVFFLPAGAMCPGRDPAAYVPAHRNVAHQHAEMHVSRPPSHILRHSDPVHGGQMTTCPAPCVGREGQQSHGAGGSGGGFPWEERRGQSVLFARSQEERAAEASWLDVTLINGHKSEQTLGDCGGQGRLA